MTYDSIAIYHLAMAVQVRITPQALEHLAELHEPILTRVNAIIQRLENWPDVSGIKPLKGPLKGSYRARTGDWRIIFRISGDVLTITSITNRRDAYEE